jgi:hypothetical protein
MAQRPQHQAAQQASPEQLDVWESRPLLILEAECARRSSVGETNGAAEPEMQETVSAGR